MHGPRMANRYFGICRTMPIYGMVHIQVAVLPKKERRKVVSAGLELAKFGRKSLVC